ncbi:MAG: hypothetical protein AB1505_24935, partial [Candidatus Latescibacterota bacterium]
AAHLAQAHAALFHRGDIELTADGPLELGDPHPHDPDRDFVVVVPDSVQRAPPYRDILAAAASAAQSTGRRLETTELGLGWGDFAKFAGLLESDLHIRSPYEGDHVMERVRIATLIGVTELWTSILLQYGSGVEATGHR